MRKSNFFSESGKKFLGNTGCSINFLQLLLLFFLTLFSSWTEKGFHHGQRKVRLLLLFFPINGKKIHSIFSVVVNGAETGSVYILTKQNNSSYL